MQALATTAAELEELEQKATALRVRRDGLIVKLRNLEDPPPIRVIAELGKISNPRVTQLEQEARARL